MKCKNVFGRKLCKFGSGSGDLVELPQMLLEPISVGIYTDKHCNKVCSPEINDFLKTIRPVKDLLDVKVYDFSEEPNAFKHGILKMPTFEIGGKMVESRANDRKIIRLIRDAIPKEHFSL
jgi:hypothetical protein